MFQSYLIWFLYLSQTYNKKQHVKTLKTKKSYDYLKMAHKRDAEHDVA